MSYYGWLSFPAIVGALGKAFVMRPTYRSRVYEHAGVCLSWRFVYLLLFVCLCVAVPLNPMGFLTAGANTDVYVWRLPIAAILGRCSLSWNMTTVKAKTRSTKARRLRFFFPRQCDTWNFFHWLPGWRVGSGNRESPQVKHRRAAHRYKLWLSWFHSCKPF